MSRTTILVAISIVTLSGCLSGVSSVQNPDAGRADDDAAVDLDMTNGGDATNVDPGDTDTPPVDGDTPTDMTSGDMNMPPGDMNMPVDMSMPTDMPTMLPPGVCGNNVVEAGETCDDCSDLDCDDQSACTVDEVGGDPANCLAYCRNQLLFECTSGDGCCPAGCTSDVDDDCSTTCGDGVVDGLETCDGDCPADCDDDDPATRDILTGSAANCNVDCVHVPIRLCADGDGYCPDGCTWATDRDCDAECGNGLIEDQETCDPPASCSNCDDGNPCTEDVMSGDPSACDVTCEHIPITACVDGDGCCGEQCDASEDADCSATCGDRQVQAGNGETCDGPPDCNAISCDQAGMCEESTGRTGHPQHCNIDCGYADITACIDSDGCCPSGCTADTDSDCDASCGNGIVEPGEYCDPPELCEVSCLDDGDVCTSTEYMGDPATCDGRCEYPAITACGPAEGCCPPGCNETNDPDCDPVCGNGVVETGEICDGNCPSCDDSDACTTDSMMGSPSTCNVICQHTDVTTCGPTEGCCPSMPDQCNALNDTDCAPVCGNGLQEPGETCDGDCPTSCSDSDVCTADVLSGSPSTCDVQCSFTTITTCGDAEGCCPSNCNANNDPDCSPVCGNGVVESGETCDGNCPTSCTDGDACTTDTLTGSAGDCTAECVFDTITTCGPTDGCCPSGVACDATTDADC